jgi:hypothetical protein
MGPLAVRFLLTGDKSTGSLAVFELMVPGGRGAIHRFDNNGTQDAKALCVITPDKAKMMEIMRRHGLTPAPSNLKVLDEIK